MSLGSCGHFTAAFGERSGRWAAEQERRYAAVVSGSRALHERSCAVLPGGDTRFGTWLHPHPLYLQHGEGSRVWDVDGRPLVDFSSPFTGVHGHCHPEVVEAIGRQSKLGTSWLGANEQQVRLAELLCERIQSFERVRFTSSGNEATMLMVRIARAYSGRDLLLKFDASAHGFYEGFELELLEDGSIGSRQGGVPRNASENVLVGRFNDAAGARSLIEEHAERLAGVIVSPVAASEAGDGYLAAEPEFLETLRSTTALAGVLLLFDEVVTFRLGRGGAQERYGVLPDLTALGKLIGGGLPAGAVGGREEVLAVTSPAERSRLSDTGVENASRWLGQSGSFNGSPAAMAAGIVTLELLTPAAYDHLERLGEALRTGLQVLAAESSLPLVVTGTGSLSSLVLDRVIWGGDGELATRQLNALRLAFCVRGILGFPHFAISTAMEMPEIENCLAVACEVFGDLEAALSAPGACRSPEPA